MMFVGTPILLLLFLVAVLIGVVLLWRTTTRPPVKHVSCARCLYSVEFVPAKHCPECGGDLTEVGVLTSEMGKTPRRPWRTVVALAIHAVPALVAGAIVATVVAALLPPASVIERIQRVPQPVSSAYQSVELSLPSSRRGDIVRLGDLCIRIEHHDGTWSRPKCFRPSNDTYYFVRDTERKGNAVVSTDYLAPNPDDPPGRYRFVDPSDLPEQALAAWADKIGLDVNDPQIRNELRAMIRVATEGFHGRGSSTFNVEHFGGPASGRISSRSQASAIPGWTMLAVTALVWLLYARGTFRRIHREREVCRAAAKEWLEHAKAPAEAGAPD